MTPAETPAPAAEVDADLLDAQLALAHRLGRIINELAGRKDVLLSMVWDRAASAIPAWFDPTMVWVTVNGVRALGEGTHPDDVNPLTLSGRLAHPVIVGMAAHEAGHARSTLWGDWAPGTGRAVVEAAALLEEPRIEGRHLSQRPDDLVFLRAMARHIVIPGLTNETVLAERWQAATATTLIISRVDAGVLTEAETLPLRIQLTAVLGAADFEALRGVGRDALALADGDQAGLAELARRWVEIVGADKDDEMTGGGCASGSPDARQDDGEGESRGNAITAAVEALVEAVSTAAQVSTGALPDPVEAERLKQAAEAAALEHATEDAARADADTAAFRVFPPVHADVRAPGRSPVKGRRNPTDVERATARRLGEALRRARFREATVTRRDSAVPPGRLSGREAMQAVAQRSQGMAVTARPFRQRVRTRAPEPPIQVGVAVDISSSMQAYTKVLASTAWAFAQAAHETGGRAATVAFGQSVTAIVRPGQVPGHVTEFHAPDGTERFMDACAALDGALGLANGTGARVLVIVSDGYWTKEEKRGGARMVKRLAERGVHVLWVCLNPSALVLPHARRITASGVEDIPAELSRALVAALGSA